MPYHKRACTNNLHSLSRVTSLIDTFDRATDFLPISRRMYRPARVKSGRTARCKSLSESFRELSTDTSPAVCEKARERFVLYVGKNFLASQPAAPCYGKNSTGAWHLTITMEHHSPL
jgi:hypothetical protein